MFKVEDYENYMQEKFKKEYPEYLRRIYLRYRVRYKENENGCFEFTGVKNKKGYGLISYNKEYKKRTTTSAHRFIYLMHHDLSLKDNRVVMHTCDNPACINIDHLQLGTQLDNMQDKINKCRCNYNPTMTRKKRLRKLTDTQVNEIRASRDTLKVIANKYDISISHACKIRLAQRKQLV